MTVKQMADACGFTPLTPVSDTEINGAFAGDLLSWAMSRVQESNVWFTVMGNINTVAVAALSECACVVLCHDAQLAQDAKDRAEKENICILHTELPEYEAITLFNTKQ